jgi:hypothetical protein
MLKYSHVRDAHIDTHNVIPSMRDEARAWLAPICDCPDLLQSVKTSLVQESRQVEEERFTDDLHVAAEAALFFCHKPGAQHIFVRDLAQQVNLLLEGGHETHSVTPKMAGSLLRKLGIRGERITAGYKIELSESLRQQYMILRATIRFFRRRTALRAAATARHTRAG